MGWAKGHEDKQGSLPALGDGAHIREAITGSQAVQVAPRAKGKAERGAPGFLSLAVAEIHLGSPENKAGAQAPPGQMESLFDGGPWASVVLNQPPPLSSLFMSK